MLFRRVSYSILLCLILSMYSSACAQSSASSSSIKKLESESEIVQASPTPTTAQSAADTPVQLQIPSLDISADIETVGLLENGDMDTPRQQPWTGVGWYSAGVRPGERGSAVIDGHLDRPGGSPAVFWTLKNSQIDDEVLVKMQTGRTLHFTVRQVATYAPREAPLQAIFGDTGGNYLNLITCAGYWVASEQQTTARLVVYTQLVSTP